MARVWPGYKDGIQHFPQEEYADVQLPPTHVQDRLIELYFTYIHPLFPVIHKARFMKEYARCVCLPPFVKCGMFIVASTHSHQSQVSRS
jgi:hypothetical protein